MKKRTSRLRALPAIGVGAGIVCLVMGWTLAGYVVMIASGISSAFLLPRDHHSTADINSSPDPSSW